MKIEKISKNRVKKLAKETEYLVWQGCGGPLEEWYNGIEQLMIESNIADDKYKMLYMYVFENNGITCLLTPLEKLNMNKLAIERLKWRETFGTMWLSDYISNNYI